MTLISEERRSSSGSGAVAGAIGERRPVPPSSGACGLGPGPWDAEVVETDRAVVLLVADRAYKLKKPMKDGPATPERRLAAYRDELRLNRRFSPDVYLSVVDITDGSGVGQDHLLVMRRLPADRRLSELARCPAGPTVDLGRALDQVADRLASVHRGSPVVPPDAATATAQDLWLRWADALRELRGVETSVGHRLIDRCESLSARYLRNCGVVFARRIADGHVREGHGNLRAENIFCLDDGARVIDCLDADPKKRCGDVLADVATLMLDLEHLGRLDLAERFSGRYRASSGTSWPASLEHHYIAMRAADLARVAAVRSQRASDEDRDAQLRLVRAYAMLAARHLHLGQPKLILVGGPPATGRSTVSHGLEDEGTGVLLRARSRPAGAGGSTGGDGTVPTYDAALEAAAGRLRTGESVIIDASWNRATDRRAAGRIAQRLGAGIVEILCRARPDTVALRCGTAETGTEEGRTPPAGEFERWPEAIVLDTDPDEPRVRSAAVDAVLGHRGEV